MKITHKLASKRKYEQIVGETGIEFTHDNHLTFQAVNLDIFPIIIITYLTRG